MGTVNGKIVISNMRKSVWSSRGSARCGRLDRNGIAKIGIYRPTTGEWFLDLNGNGKWDGSATNGYSRFLD
jgi:hypothetical protein